MANKGSEAGSLTPSEQSDEEERSEGDSDYESEEQENHRDSLNIVWTGYGRRTPVIVFDADAVLRKKGNKRIVGERYHLAYKFGSAECKVVRNILNGHGFHEVHPNSSDYSIVWTGSHLKPFTLRGLTEFQKINHFPRSYELTRKDRLYKNIQRMQQIRNFKQFDFIPQSFILPSEYQDFCASYLKDKSPWIIKPVASSRGRGVFLVHHPDQVPLDENLIVSKYLHNPFLIDGFKFDIRLYVVVTSYDPLMIYLYEEGLTRFATVKYERGNRHIRNQCMHLTNYSVNKKSDDYVKNDDADIEDYGNKWSLGAMLRYLRAHGKDTAAMMMRIEDVIIKTIISVELPVATACKMFMPHRGNCFELYGFDILVDESLKPWVLEVNLSPSLACDTPLDLKIKTNLICDMFSLTGIVCHDPVMRTLQQSRRNQDIASKMAARAKKQRPQSAGASSISSLNSKNSDKSNNNSNKYMAGLNSDEIKILRRVKEEDQRKGGFVRIFPTSDSWDLYSYYLQFNTSYNLMVHQRIYPHRHRGTTPVQKGSTATSSIAARAKNAYSSLGSGRKSVDTEHAEAYSQALLRTRKYERKLSSRKSRRQNRRKAKHKNGSKVNEHEKLVQGIQEDGEEDNNSENEDENEEGEEQEDNSNNKEVPEPSHPMIEIEVEKSDSTIPMNRPPVTVNAFLTPAAKTVQPQLPQSKTTLAPKLPDPSHRLPPRVPVHSHLPFHLNSSTENVSCDLGSDIEEGSSLKPSPPEVCSKLNVVELLQKGQLLSKVQARSAFAMYLIRVQQRLMAESSSSSQEDIDALNEQMDLVLRFLKRAAVNLQQSFKIVVPSRKLPLSDRRRILAKQLGDFVHIYNKKTEQVKARRQLDRKHLRRSDIVEGLDENKFEKFVNTASEGELEEVLTTYTKINKSASIFLGGGSAKSEGKMTVAGHTLNAKPDNTVSKHDSVSEFDNEAKAMTSWEDIPRVSSSSNVGDCRPGVFVENFRPASANYLSPSQSSYANAVHIYSQKLGNRPKSASFSGQKQGGKSQPRPMSAFSSRPASPHVTSDPTVDTYNEQAIQQALQRLAMRQQARQYSAYNNINTIQADSRPSSASGPRVSEHRRPLNENDFADHGNSNAESMAHFPAQNAVEMGREGTYASDAGSRQSQTKYITMEEHMSRSKPPIGPQNQKQQNSTTFNHSHPRPIQTNVKLQTANATFNSFIDEQNPSWPNDLSLAYSQVTGVKPQNYHMASASSKQYQLLQQQMLKQQSKALLEQSKAKHQTMVAQAHAVQKSIQQHLHRERPNSDSDLVSQKFAPKPPVQPAGTKRSTCSHRLARTAVMDDPVVNQDFYGSLKFDKHTGLAKP